MIKVRHTDEWVGALVIAAMAVMLVAALQAGVLRDWFKPTSELRLVLPEGGVGGLEVGADAEILGTRAGRVKQIVLDPNQQMYALIDLDEQATAFIRRDSSAVIRRRFGVAGAAFVDISRGTGEEMDWSYAVIEATTERAPTDSISALIDEVREKVFPILDNAGNATRSLAEIVDRINRGEGSVGRLLVDEALVQQVETIVASARDATGALNQLMQKLGGAEGVPGVLAQADTTMSTVQRMLDDLAVAAKNVPAIAKNVEGGTANLPALLSQLQVTVDQLDKLIVQIRNSWLLGGGAPQPQQPTQFSPSQVLP
jgi:phospholipid/cholesterol/gamma-HCH transport system substrate-binding protein